MDAGRRLRIAFVSDLFEGVRTGGVVSAARFAAALAARHEVLRVGAGPGVDVRLPAFRLPGFGRVMREMGFEFAVPLRRVLEPALAGADVVHLQFPFWLGLRSAALARALGVPLVVGFHVQPENLFRNVGLDAPRLVEATYRLFLARYFERADAVVCPSDFAREELRRRGLRAPAEVISNGVGPEFEPGPRPAEGPRPFLVLAVGRLAREKRLDVVVEGVRRSRHARRIRLVITGRGPAEAEVRRRAATLPVPGEVAFVSDEALRALFRSADLLLHASEVELEGMAVLEAAACGLPALVADAPGSAAGELAAGPELRFAPGDPADLARRLDALLDAPARREAARSACLALARARSLEASVRRLEALYRRLVSAREARGDRRAGATATPAAR